MTYEVTPVEPTSLVFSRAAAREIDRLAIEEFAIPSIVLMENAAIGIARAAQRMVADPARRAGPSALIVCGKSNNGGDGFAAARHLHNEGWRLALVLGAEPGGGPGGGGYKGDAGVNLEICRRMKLSMCVADKAHPTRAMAAAVESLGGPDLIIDAILGTGASGSVRGLTAGLVRGVNDLAAQGTPVLAVDLPSALDADTGVPLAVADDLPEPFAVRASATVTFVGPKRGFSSLSAQPYLGEVTVAGIGVPAELVRRLGEVVKGSAAADSDFAARWGGVDSAAGRGRNSR